jgi:2,5-diamino-6-(ribosylamino)-4(3H)-pyrimidinone 5'-phosphate reductase
MRPSVFVNLAMSADGKISTRERRQVRISGDADFARVDQVKAESDAIMVGIGTVLADDPSLTVKSPDLRAQRREKGMDEHPVRIVVDSTARTPPGAAILHRGSGKRIIAVASRAPENRVETLREYADIVVAGTDRVDLPLLLDQLSAMGIRRLMVEGGGSLIWSLFRENCVDELITFIGNVIIGGENAPTPADGEGFIREADFPRLRLLSCEVIQDGVLLRWSVEQTR